MRGVLDDGDGANVICSVGIRTPEYWVCSRVGRGLVGYCPAEPVPVGVVSEESIVGGHAVVFASGLGRTVNGESVPLAAANSAGDNLVSGRVLTESLVVLDSLDPDPSLGSIWVIIVRVTLSSPGDVIGTTRHIEVVCVVSVPERVPARVVGSWDYMSGRS